MKQMTAMDFEVLRLTARDSTRHRAHCNIHSSLDAQVQRLFIAMQPDTYVRPHRHSQDYKWELFVLLEGAISVLILDEEGCVRERIEMTPADIRMVEIPPHTWHTLVCQAPDTVMFEVKEGAYVVTEDKDFAAWAPKEGEAGAAALLEKLRAAQPGESLLEL